MNTNLNPEEYPRLTPPDVVFENKASLKKPLVMPLYAKIVSAAAVVALLFGVFWIRSSRPKMEWMAELKPIEAVRIESDETVALAESKACFVVPKKAVTAAQSQPKMPVANEREEMPLLAELQPKTAPTLVFDEQKPDELLDSDVYYAFNDLMLQGQAFSYDNDLSLVGRTIYWMTDGEHSSFADLFSEGFRNVKTEMASIATTVQSSRDQLRQRVR